MLLYHFLSSEWAIEDLRERRLKIARLNDLNDPFELLGYEQTTPAHREAFRKSKAYMADNYGLLCFSRDWTDPVLWSHYADKHRGMCLGFDVAEQLLLPVAYETERPPFPPELTEEFAKPLLSTKYKGWGYEKEARVFLRLDPLEERDGLFYAGFSSRVKLKQVIVGPLCNKRAELLPIIKPYGGAIEVIKARLAFRSFAVVADQRGFWGRHATMKRKQK